MTKKNNSVFIVPSFHTCASCIDGENEYIVYNVSVPVTHEEVNLRNFPEFREIVFKRSKMSHPV